MTDYIQHKALKKHWLERWIDLWEDIQPRPGEPGEEPELMGDNSKFLKVVPTQRALNMVGKGTYRSNAYDEQLEDHEGRIEVLEFFIQGRERCTGDALWDEVEESSASIKNLRYYVLVLVATFVLCIFGALTFAENIVVEQRQQIDDLQHQIERLEMQKCGLDARYKTSSEDH